MVSYSNFRERKPGGKKGGWRTNNELNRPTGTLKERQAIQIGGGEDGILNEAAYYSHQHLQIKRTYKTPPRFHALERMDEHTIVLCTNQ